MTLHRSPFLPALAASMSVLLLAGCPNAGTAPPLPGDLKFSAAPSTAPSASTGTSASAAPSASPSAATSPRPSASASAGASASPGASATPVQTQNPTPTGAKTILAGKIYDEQGAVVDGAVVTVKSLDTRAAFTGTATSASGSYVVNDVPVGAQIEVTIEKAGWTTRRRVTSLQDRTSARNTLDFGGLLTAANTEDPSGVAFFISNYPEIASATPGVSPVTGDKLSYKVKFSEPLDEDNRDLVVNSFEISGTAIARPLIPTAQATGQRLVIQEGSTFLDSSRKAAFTWNAAGDELTFTFDVPLRASGTDDKAYTFKLLRRTGDELIEDAEGKILGLVAPTVNDSYNAIKRATLTVRDVSNTPRLRWDDTHNKSTSFDVKEDETRPKLTGVSTNKIVRSDLGNREFRRFSLTFSEPMRVYPDAHGYAQSLIDLANYTFAFSEDNDLKGLDMDDTFVAYDVAARTAADLRTGTTTYYEKPLRFSANADVKIQPSDSNPNVLEIDILDSEFPSQLKTVKVKVSTNVTDPAGNRISESGETADKIADNVVEGRF